MELGFGPAGRPCSHGEAERVSGGGMCHAPEGGHGARVTYEVARQAAVAAADRSRRRDRWRHRRQWPDIGVPRAYVTAECGGDRMIIEYTVGLR
jgi:hypothetical protein